MPNKYCNLIGTNKIKDEYPKINDGFAGVEEDTKSLQGQINSMQAADSNAMIGVYSVTTEGSANAYTVTYEGLTYFTGLKLSATIHEANTGASTLNLNDLGEKDIKVLEADGSKTDVLEKDLSGMVLLQYDGVDWVFINDTKLRDDISELQQINTDINIKGEGERIEKGTKTVTPDTSFSSVPTVITFEKSFSEIPIVKSSVNSVTIGGKRALAYSIDVTRTGFTLTVATLDATNFVSATSAEVSWIAIGE